MHGQSLRGNWRRRTCIAQGSALKLSSLVVNIRGDGISFKHKQVAWGARLGLGLTDWLAGMHERSCEVGVEEFINVLRTESGVNQTTTQVAQRWENNGDERQR